MWIEFIVSENISAFAAFSGLWDELRGDACQDASKNKINRKKIIFEPKGAEIMWKNLVAETQTILFGSSLGFLLELLRKLVPPIGA